MHDAAIAIPHFSAFQFLNAFGQTKEKTVMPALYLLRRSDDAIGLEHPISTSLHRAARSLENFSDILSFCD